MDDHTFTPLHLNGGVVAACSCGWSGRYTHGAETAARESFEFHQKMNSPAPGTREAIDAGCSCPVLDNSHGWGYRRRGEFIISMGCSVHAQHISTPEVLAT